ncbi:hypothetical protein ACI65C_010970, partial [Semiaphis heraclei]
MVVCEKAIAAAAAVRVGRVCASRRKKGLPRSINSRVRTAVSRTRVLVRVWCSPLSSASRGSVVRYIRTVFFFFTISSQSRCGKKKTVIFFSLILLQSFFDHLLRKTTETNYKEFCYKLPDQGSMHHKQ